MDLNDLKLKNFLRDKKCSKSNALTSLEWMIENVLPILPEAFDTAWEYNAHFEALLSYFDDNKPTKKVETDDLAWVYQAVSKDKERKRLQLIYCDQGDEANKINWLVSNDGRRMHYIECNIRKNIPTQGCFKQGYYNGKGNKIELDEPYANWRQVIPTSDSEIEVSKLEVGIGPYSETISLKHPDNGSMLLVLTEKHWREAIVGMDNPMLYWNGAYGDRKNGPIKVTDGKRNAVMMPWKND